MNFYVNFRSDLCKELIDKPKIFIVDVTRGTMPPKSYPVPNSNKNKITNEYSNFRYIFPSADGYSAAYGMSKGGYLGRAIKNVLTSKYVKNKYIENKNSKNLSINYNYKKLQTIDEMISQVRKESNRLIGKLGIIPVEDVNNSLYNVKLKRRKQYKSRT